MNFAHHNICCKRKTILARDAAKILSELKMPEHFYVFWNKHTKKYAKNHKNYKNINISIKTAQNIFKAALKNAGIKRNLSIKALRYSFMLHLFDSGVPKDEIQKMTGGNLNWLGRLKKEIKIESPLDKLNLAS